MNVDPDHNLAQRASRCQPSRQVRHPRRGACCSQLPLLFCRRFHFYARRASSPARITRNVALSHPRNLNRRGLGMAIGTKQPPLEQPAYPSLKRSRLPSTDPQLLSPLSTRLLRLGSPARQEVDRHQDSRKYILWVMEVGVDSNIFLSTSKIIACVA